MSRKELFHEGSIGNSYYEVHTMVYDSTLAVADPPETVLQMARGSGHPPPA